MGGGKDKDGYDESDKGLFSNLTHAIAGGHNPSGHYPPQGYPPQGYPPQGYSPSGYPPQGGYPPSGYPPHGGYPPSGYPPQGYPQEVIPVLLPHITQVVTTQVLVGWDQCWLEAQQQLLPPMVFHIWHMGAAMAMAMAMAMATVVVATLATETLCMVESSSLGSMENSENTENLASIKESTVGGNLRNGSDIVPSNVILGYCENIRCYE